MHVLKTLAGAAIASVVSASGLSCASPAGAQGAPPGTGAQVLQKLLANRSFPYTQVSFGVPRLALRGVTAQDAALVTGLRFVVDEPRSTLPAGRQPSQLGVWFGKENLLEVRSVGGTTYVWAGVRNWLGLPVRWTPSDRRVIAVLDLGYGERWFALPQAALLRLAQQKAAPGSLGSRLGAVQASSRAIRSALTASFEHLLEHLSFSQTAATDGNVVYRSSGSLQALGQELAGFFAAITRTVPGAGVLPFGAFGSAAATKGSYALAFGTAGHGAYVSTVDLAIGATGVGSLSFELDLTHVPMPVVAPKQATAVPLQALTGTAP